MARPQSSTPHLPHLQLNREPGLRGLPLVEQLVEALAGLIGRGELRSGERLPSVRQLAAQHGIGISTVVEAYERLVARGLLLARRGAGFFVAARVAQGQAGAVFMPHEPAVDSAWLLSEMYADERIPIKAGCGWLPGKWLDGAGLHQAQRRVMRAPGAQQVAYGHPYGYAPLRQLIVQFLGNWSLDASIDQVVTTHGATQALDLVIRTMTQPSDTVMIEQPGYCNLIAMLRLAGLNVIGVPRTTAGVDADQLDQLAALHRPKLFFTTTVLQNPTGTTYTPACAMRVLQAAERHGFWVVEDDIFRELGQPTDPMLAALDGLQRVIYIGSYSKTIAPSLRVGYLACQRALARQIVHTKMVLSLTHSEINERLVHSVLTEGHHRRHVQTLGATLLDAQSALHARLIEAGLMPFATARGGMFTWATLAGCDLPARAIADRARQQGIWLAPGDFFHLGAPPATSFRFNVGFADVPALFAFFRSL